MAYKHPGFGLKSILSDDSNWIQIHEHICWFDYNEAFFWKGYPKSIPIVPIIDFVKMEANTAVMPYCNFTQKTRQAYFKAA